MITKMKKVMLFTPDISQNVDEDLTRLGQLGVVHIAPFQPAQDESIDRVGARIKQMQTAMDALESIGRNRGCLQGGGTVNLHKASELLLNEFRNKQLGAISLETPQMAEAEIKAMVKNK